MDSKEENLYKPRTFKPKYDESEDILKFMAKQTNFNDTVRYLMEKEIYENGIRNLQEIIPAFRNKEYFQKYFESFQEVKIKAKDVVEVFEIENNDKVNSIVEDYSDENLISKQVVEANSLKEDLVTDTEEVKEDVIADEKHNEVLTKEDNEIKDEEVLEDDDIPECYR